MRIAVFGLGYVGCVSLGCLAESGHEIIGVDPNQHKVQLINQGRPTIIEDQLDRILRREFENNRFSATQNHDEAVLDMALNHAASQTRGGVLGVYQTAKRMEERKAALLGWSDRLMTAIHKLSSEQSTIQKQG